MDLNKTTNILQTIALIVFGFVWVRIVRHLKRDK